MLDAAVKALADMFTPPLRSVLLKTVGLSIALLVVIGIAVHRLLVWLLVAGGGWLEHAMDPEPFTATTPYSESHAARFEDLNGDGVPELITGKRKFAHGTGGEGYAEPGVLVYYKLRVDQTGVNWDRFDIDLEQASGVGTQFDVRDVNGDGLLDVVISNKTGLYYFEQIPR